MIWPEIQKVVSGRYLDESAKKRNLPFIIVTWKVWGNCTRNSARIFVFRKV